MRVVRRVASGEWELEHVVLGVFPLGVLGTLLLRWLPGACIPRCWMHAVLGVPCPTCGSYRAAKALSQGCLADALRWQPLGLLLGMLGAALFLYALRVVWGRRERVRLVLEHPRERLWLWSGAIALVLANWVYLAYTLPG